MRIVYDSLDEYAEVVIRCHDIARKGNCAHCPFYAVCVTDEPENRCVRCAEIDKEKE